MTAIRQNDSDVASEFGTSSKRKLSVTTASAILELLDRLKTFVDSNRELINAAFGPVDEAVEYRPAQTPEPPQVTVPVGNPANPAQGNAAVETSGPDEQPAHTLVEVKSAIDAEATKATTLPALATMGADEAIAQLRLSTGITPRAVTTVRTAGGQLRDTPYLDEFSRIRRLARAHERALRALRRLRRDGANVRAQRCLQDRIAEANLDRLLCWFGDHEVVNRLSTEDLANLGLRYQSLSEATGWLNELLTNSPACVARGASESDRAKLKERMQAVATAQCGLRTEVDRVWAGRGVLPCCELQGLAFSRVSSAVHRDSLGIYLDQMTRRSTVDLAGSKRLIAAIESARMREDRVDDALAMEQAIAVEDTSECGGELDDDDWETVASAFAGARSELARHSDAIVLTNRAEESAAESSFRRPEAVRRALLALGEAASQWHLAPNGALNCSFRDLLLERGFDEKPAAEGTMQRYQDSYRMNFEGREVPIGRHMTLGSGSANTCLSIHWWRDDDLRRVVVGHCGRHLPNMLS